MSEPDWKTVAEPTDEAGARIVLGLLESESIPARIKSNVPVPGLPISFQVQVNSGFVERAQSLLAGAQFSEDELASLAIASPPVDEP
ncbi:MAG TPA: DUF2007 domain-containing protein [Povalibacter sp.]|uniref:putative signal transducing protein n=1 Tax=Povalibacter sp. TaxID=1962978 RepID=UPI002C310D36|nr:hypothetical protein [Povalibacter sp.]HMN46254.1 DUF2007 domain-containing protein [Povalibacter sp.]